MKGNNSNESINYFLLLYECVNEKFEVKCRIIYMEEYYEIRKRRK